MRSGIRVVFHFYVFVCVSVFQREAERDAKLSTHDASFSNVGVYGVVPEDDEDDVVYPLEASQWYVSIVYNNDIILWFPQEAEDLENDFYDDETSEPVITAPDTLSPGK